MNESLPEIVSLETPATRNRLEHYASAAIAENTVRAYRADWDNFARWAVARNLQAQLPISPHVWAEFLCDLADQGYAISTLQRRIASMAKLHRARGCESPHNNETFRLVWRGIRRRLGVEPERKDPLLLADLLMVLGRIGTDRLIDLRDRAILLFGWAGGFRRSELIGLQVGDLVHQSSGILVHLRRSKTDQEGSGRWVPIHARRGQVCPVRFLLRWITVAGLAEKGGPLFRPIDRHGNLRDRQLSGRSIGSLVQSRIAAAGMEAMRFGAHSLRSGLAVSAKAAGASDIEIQRVTGHRSLRGLATYLQAADSWTYDPAGQAGLGQAAAVGVVPVEFAAPRDEQELSNISAGRLQGQKDGRQQHNPISHNPVSCTQDGMAQR